MSNNSLDTFMGRFSHFVSVTDPRTLLKSDEEVLKSKAILDEYKKNPSMNIDPKEIKSYEYLVNSAIHPVTGDIIPRLFRVSAIAPFNIPLVFAMITCPASNVGGTLFLHWLNQSYNTACNYANRSGLDQPWEQTAKAYGLAVSSACSFAYGLGKLQQSGPPIFRRMGAFIPLIATAVASSSNLMFTRFDEIQNGVPMVDSDGTEYGYSKKAGQQVVMQTALTRCVLVPAACLLLPAATMKMLGRVNLLPKSTVGKMTAEISIIFLSLQAAMPAALAIFPQTAKFSTSELETSFQSLKDSTGKAITELFTNKGL